MGKISTLLKMIHVLRSKQNMGDAALYKLTLLSKKEGPSDYREAALKTEEINYQPIEPQKLAELPSSTFGHAYYQFMQSNGLDPLNFSGETRELFGRYPVSARYIRLHDLFHVLLDFDPSPEGEVGVYAFVRKQNYNSTLNWAGKTAMTLCWLLFWKWNKMKAVIKRGEELASKSEPIITYPLESYFHLPLAEVRQKLKLS